MRIFLVLAIALGLGVFFLRSTHSPMMIEETSGSGAEETFESGMDRLAARLEYAARVGIRSGLAPVEFENQLAPGSQFPVREYARYSYPSAQPPPPRAPCTPNVSSTGSLSAGCGEYALTEAPRRPSTSHCPYCSQIENASLAFNRPERMTYQESEDIELVIAPDTAGIRPRTHLSDNLDGTVQERGDIPYTLRMRAHLSGNDFTISPSAPQDRTVLPDRPTKWTWQVRPQSFGDDKQLVIEVSTILEIEGNTLPPSTPVIFRETIPVDIELWDRVVFMAADIKLVHGLIVAIIGSLVTAAVWIRKRLKAKPEATPSEGNDQHDN
ncbi:hypothetical protein [Qingshengfaniella alkalisoli]|uniref:Uncharacterized protein n=1 Tax=Qingshengfaniella alkalisoli TaxID=2599296 RepID=A0A5B8J5Q9_9RHOB|nr:hypothetical protein [Qingshengfaniella alkalisoli]QDY69827.1 hypothetical protein FPZ52_09480 [Qingshengfaniella alkalisoli]